MGSFGELPGIEPAAGLGALLREHLKRMITGCWAQYKSSLKFVRMQFHRFASLILGIWLGVSVFMDFVAVENFHSVSRVMGSLDVRAVETAKKVSDPDALRQLLRYFAGETNRYLFEQWEWAELLLGLALLLVLLFGRTYQKFAMSLCVLMMVIVVVQRFKLTPAITELGRELEFSTSASRRFASYHAAYGYVEIAKIAMGLMMAVRLLIRRGSSKKAFVREYQREREA
jgi:hypothetical protein